jgi:hypothetical protein
MLDAGSSRVFNCNDVARKLEHREAAHPYLFKTPAMHHLVLIKEALRYDDPRHPKGQVIGSKLYLPYNRDDVYEGGRSIFFHSPNLLQVFHEQFGVEITEETSPGLENDMKIFRILDDLPSLDGFLMRDALELEGIHDADDAYFDVSPDERVAIQEFIRGKMEPLVRAAYGGKKPPSNKVTQLIDAMWEAKDLAALEPLILAFRFPKDEALAIFGAWKGINFYSFEYHRARKRRESFAHWLKEEAMPKGLVAREVQQLLEPIRRTTIERLRGHWIEIDDILKQYDKLYSEFVASANPGGFIGFLRGAKKIYWQLGDSLSKIDHAINCWDIWTKAAPSRRLPFEQLEAMLELLKKILVPSSNERAQAA